MKSSNSPPKIYSLSKLKNIRRRTIDLASTKLVETSFISSQQAIPFVIKSKIDGLDISQWMQHNRNWVENLLLQHGALLFRGFQVKTAGDFQQFAEVTVDGKLLKYIDRTSPRTAVGNKIYTSTIYPANYQILLHNELTYALKYPRKVYFCCLKVAETGGETPIADSRQVYQRIDPEIRDRFKAKKWMLVRNYNDGLGLPWQEVFQTEDTAKVEAYCLENSIEFSWKENSRLQTRQVREAIHYHHQTNEPIWFNHAAFFHHTNTNLFSEFNKDELPYNTYYGDGSEIEPDVIAHINQAYEEEKVIFPWQEGDILMLDNLSVAHGRQPYTGERRVLLAMN